MNYDMTAAQMLKIIKAVILGEKVDISSMDIDWDRMYTLTEYHSVTNLIAYAIDESVPQEIADIFAKSSTIAFARYMGYEHETAQICKLFEENKISYMPLKGHIMKNYYPSPEMRTMCDVDILVKEQDLEAIDTVMAKCGYTKLPVVREDEVTYQKQPLFCYEMHLQLVRYTHKKIFDYYGDGWEFARKDTEFGYKMSDEDFFVFLIAHLAKHYRTAGVGVRPVVDIWIYLKKFRDKLDWGYVDGELDKLGMKDFAYNVFKLTEFWFEGASPEKKISDMSSYVLTSGIYGNVVNDSITKEMRQETKHSSSLVRYIQAIFIGYEPMAEMFPKIKKFPPLIVYYWVKRLVVKIFDGSGKKYIALQKEISSENAQNIKEHFDDIGIQ